MTESIGGCLWPGEKRICVQMGGTVKKNSKLGNRQMDDYMSFQCCTRAYSRFT